MISITLLKDKLNTHFNKLNYIDKNKLINIIVVGGYNLINYSTVNKTDIETWNNPKQCKYSDMINFKRELEKDYNVSMSNFDPQFPETISDIEIPHYKDGFYLNNELSLLNKTYYIKNAINIVILFTPFDGLDENWPIKGNLPDFSKVKHFDIKYIICGCLWDKGFPTEIITNILKYNLKTPTEPYSTDSYLYMIKTIKLFNENNIYQDMKPYILPIFQILGNPSLRGFEKNNYIGSAEMKKLMQDLLTIQEFKQNFSKEQIEAINNNNKWNDLSIDIKNIICKSVYGINECKYNLLSK